MRYVGCILSLLPVLIYFLIGTIQTIDSDRTQNNSQYNHNQSFKRLMAKIKIIKTIVYFFVYKTLITFRQHPHHFIQLFINR